MQVSLETESDGAHGSRTPKHATACERGDAVFCSRNGSALKSQTLLDLPRRLGAPRQRVLRRGSRIIPKMRVPSKPQNPKTDYGISSTRHHINPRPRSAKVPTPSPKPTTHQRETAKQPKQTAPTHFRDNRKKPQKRPRFQPPKPQKNTRANTPRVIFITSRTNLSINEKPTSEGSRHTTRVSDSELNRHG